MKVTRPIGMARKAKATSIEPNYQRFLVCFVVTKHDGTLADCPSLQWGFGTFSEAKAFVDKARDMLRYGNGPNNVKARDFPYVSIVDIRTCKRYDYQV